MATMIDGIADLKTRVGEHIGYSEWHQITAEQVQLFADATGDHQWIHLDEERPRLGRSAEPLPMATSHCRWPRC